MNAYPGHVMQQVTSDILLVFSVSAYREIQMNFLANPIFRHIGLQFLHLQVK